METVATPKSVNIRNPIALEKIAKAAAAGLGRNCTEAAENLILHGFDLISEREQDALANAAKVATAPG